MKIPNHQFVVVATRGQLLVVKTPFETTDLLLVPSHLRKVLAWGTQVTLQDVAITAARANNGLVPGDGAHTSRVTIEVTNQLVLLRIPDLSVA